MKLIGLVGSNSDQSTNRQLLQFMKKHFADHADIELVEIKGIPMFDKPEEVAVPEVVEKISQKIIDADGVIIATPEYNHSFPAALTNALAWLSYGIYPFVDKPVLITGCSYGRLGSSRAQSQLRQALNAPELKARLMPGDEFLIENSLQAFDENNNLKDPEKIKELENIFENFDEFVEISKKLDYGYTKNLENAEKFTWE